MAAIGRSVLAGARPQPLPEFHCSITINTAVFEAGLFEFSCREEFSCKKDQRIFLCTGRITNAYETSSNLQCTAQKMSFSGLVVAVFLSQAQKPYRAQMCLLLMIQTAERQQVEAEYESALHWQQCVWFGERAVVQRCPYITVLSSTKRWRRRVHHTSQLPISKQSRQRWLAGASWNLSTRFMNGRVFVCSQTTRRTPVVPDDFTNKCTWKLLHKWMRQGQQRSFPSARQNRNWRYRGAPPELVIAKNTESGPRPISPSGPSSPLSCWHGTYHPSTESREYFFSMVQHLYRVWRNQYLNKSSNSFARITGKIHGLLYE